MIILLNFNFNFIMDNNLFIPFFILLAYLSARFISFLSDYFTDLKIDYNVKDNIIYLIDKKSSLLSFLILLTLLLIKSISFPPGYFIYIKINYNKSNNNIGLINKEKRFKKAFLYNTWFIKNI